MLRGSEKLKISNLKIFNLNICKSIIDSWLHCSHFIFSTVWKFHFSKIHSARLNILSCRDKVIPRFRRRKVSHSGVSAFFSKSTKNLHKSYAWSILSNSFQRVIPNAIWVHAWTRSTRPLVHLNFASDTLCCHSNDWSSWPSRVFSNSDP